LQKRQLSRLVNTVRKEWGEAERLIRENEVVSGEIVVAAVNELRYAGTHLVLGLEDIAGYEDNGRALSELESALTHIRRSKTDLRDQLLNYIRRDVQRMMERFGGPVIAEKFPDFPNLTSKLNKVSEQIVNIRSTHSNDYQEYQKSNNIGEQISELRVLHRRLIETEAYLKPRSKDTDQWSYWKSVAVVLAGAAGTILAIFAGL
jgi:DNA repair exonuclease SbcCD ATPase subunit